jgi:hypothetical protein
MIKRLLLLFCLLGGIGTAWFLESPYYTLVRIDRALESHDVVTLEKFADLKALAQAGVDAEGARVNQAIGVRDSDPAGKLVGDIVGFVAHTIGSAAAWANADEMRRQVRDGHGGMHLGPFTPNTGWRALGVSERHGDETLVELNGTCEGFTAMIKLRFTRHEDGRVSGHPTRYVLTGVDDDSLKSLARMCTGK